MLLFIGCDHSKPCLSISILQMAATRWLLLAACVVSPCAWCTLTSGPRLSYSKLMHHAAKASFRMFISIWPADTWSIQTSKSHLQNRWIAVILLQYSRLFGISETCSWSVLYRRAMWLQRSTFCCCLVPIRRSHAETAANWTCSASWRKGWLRLHVCHVNFHSPSLFSHAFDLIVFPFSLSFCQFFNIFFVDQILLSRQFRGRGSPERALHLVDLDPRLLRCALHTWLVSPGSLAGRNGCSGEPLRFSWGGRWCDVLLLLQVFIRRVTAYSSLKAGYLWLHSAIYSADLLSALLGCNRADCLWFWCAKGAVLLWTNFC